MTEYLAFAKILDELFKDLSECGILTNYTVQLQSNVMDSETLYKFRAIIQELIENLKTLLVSILSVEARTQTLDEVVVTCQPIGITTLRTSKMDSKIVEQNENAANEFHEKHGSDINSRLRVPAIEICQLKPILIGTTENLSQIINYEPSTEMEKDTVDNVVHIVVEAPRSDSGHSSHNPNTNTDKKIEEDKCTDYDVSLKSKEEERLNNVQTQNCDLCDKGFTCLQNLQAHCRREHNGAGCFSCSTCNKRFMTKLSYNRHLDTHRGKKEAVCNLCGKAFSRADYLQTHYQTHQGKRNFACSQCPRKFVRSIYLKVHEKIHTGIKDHICKVCNKGFARRDKLKEHVLRHLNIKRFKCTICHRDYAEKRDLKLHLKSHSK